MGGLLDKANAAKEPETEAAAEPEPVLAAEPAVETPVAKVSTSSDGASLFAQFSKPGMALGGLAFVLTWFLGSYTLEDLTGPVPFGLVVLLMFVGSFYLVWQSVDREKTVVLAVGYLLLAGVPYGAGLLNDGFVGITDVAFSEEGDELMFKVRGSFNSVDISIRADGAEVWSGSDDLSNDIKNFKVPITEMFAGNGELFDGKADVEYTIYAESSNGLTNEVPIPSKLVTREAQDAGIRIASLQNSNNNDEYLGITIEALVGLINPNFQNSNGGGFQAVGLRPMNGDYTIDISVTGGDSWSESTITVDEDTASWASQSSGIGSATTSGWFGLTGTDEDNNGVLYLDKADFYDDPGCYTFTVDIVNTVSPTTTHTTSWSWEIDLSTGNGQESVPKGFGIGETC
jgi:hypothetical protein